LLEALRSEPNNRELRLALLEASCLSGAWSRGTEQIPLVTPFTQQEALPMFYAAVVLYETGRAEEARGYMERALPRVSGPFVDEYAKKILGRS
jgi:protein involved in temperature-dependent protein secretion